MRKYKVQNISKTVEGTKVYIKGMPLDESELTHKDKKEIIEEALIGVVKNILEEK